MAATLGYTIPARVYPVVITCLPIALAVAAWFPNDSWPKSILSATATLGALGMLAAQLGRDLGKQKEPELWLAWGGKPTTQLMRHRDRQLDAITKQRYHNKIAHLIPITIPTPDVEMAEPGIADDTYDSCVIWLISRTRSTSNYPLLFKENVNYGFRRNLWAMRPAGILIAAFGLLFSILPLFIYRHEPPRAAALLAVVINAFLLALWLLRFKQDWVRLPAYRYSRELLSALDTMQP